MGQGKGIIPTYASLSEAMLLVKVNAFIKHKQTAGVLKCRFAKIFLQSCTFGAIVLFMFYCNQKAFIMHDNLGRAFLMTKFLCK